MDFSFLKTKRMKRIVLTLTSVLIGLSSFAQSDTTDLNTYIDSNFPDNTAGFITPERLRNVAKEVGRSSANLLERNEFAEPLQVNDTIKSTEGFFVWNGSSWDEVGDLSDTTIWDRSGGFILPLEYSDKLSVDTARIGGLLYPNDATVNVGTSSAPFDTLFANELGGDAAILNTLDKAYDEGGAGVGRVITADNGAVEVIGQMSILNDDTWFGNDSLRFKGLGSWPISGGYSLDGTDLDLFAYFKEGWLGNPYPAHEIRLTKGDTVSALKIFKGTTIIDQLFALGSTWGGVGNFGYEVQIVSGHPQTKMYATNHDGSTNLAVVNVDTMKIEFEFDGIVPFRVDSDNVFIGNALRSSTLKYIDGNESDGAFLVSDADGVASWTDVPSLDFSGVPSYANRAAAESALGVGFLFLDESNDKALKVTE